MSILSKRLRYIRGKRGLAQKFVAEKLDIKSNTLSGYESGNRDPDPEMLTKIADFYKVTTDYLLGRSDTPFLTQKEDIQSDLEYEEWLESLEHLPEEKKEEAIKELKQYADYLMKTKFNKN